TIEPDGHVSVRDNGRGIPVDTVEKTGLSGVETVLTVLHAGGKFGGGGYKVSGGLHGVGASVVNALSQELEVEVRQNRALWRQTYERGVPTSPLAKVRGEKPEDTGTFTRWLPDSEVFETLDYDFDMLAGRFREMAYLTKGVFIRFIDLRGDGHERSYYFDSGVEAFVRHINRGKGLLHPDPIYVTEERDDTFVEVGLQYNASYGE